MQRLTSTRLTDICYGMGQVQATIPEDPRVYRSPPASLYALNVLLCKKLRSASL